MSLSAEPPGETAQVLPQASLSQSQAAAHVQESCISALCPSLGPASCPGLRAKGAALSGPPQPRFWLRGIEGWYRRVNSRGNPYRNTTSFHDGASRWEIEAS